MNVICINQYENNSLSFRAQIWIKYYGLIILGSDSFFFSHSIPMEFWKFFLQFKQTTGLIFSCILDDMNINKCTFNLIYSLSTKTVENPRFSSSELKTVLFASDFHIYMQAESLTLVRYFIPPGNVFCIGSRTWSPTTRVSRGCRS